MTTVIERNIPDIMVGAIPDTLVDMEGMADFMVGVISVRNPVITGGMLLISDGMLVISGGNPVITGGMLLISGAMLVISGGNPVITGGMLLYSDGILVISGGNPVITGGMLLISNGMLGISGENPVIIGGMLLISGGRTVMAGGRDTGMSVFGSGKLVLTGIVVLFAETKVVDARMHESFMVGSLTTVCPL